MDSVVWAAVGLLVVVGVMLLLLRLAHRSRTHRPPPKPVAAPRDAVSLRGVTGPVAESPTHRWEE